MRTYSLALGIAVATCMGVYSAQAVLPSPAYVNVYTGNNANVSSGCAQLTPCADLNTALSVLGTGGPNIVIIIGGGLFGPIIANQPLTIVGTDPNQLTNILADLTAQVGCIGHLPASCGLTNNGYALEWNGGGGASDNTLNLTNIAIRSGDGSTNALKIGSGIGVTITNCVFSGGGSGPAIQIYPNNGSTSFMAVYLSHSFITGGSNTNAGAIEVKPSGSTSVGLHFNHVEISGASYGIRTDGSLLSAGGSVSTFVSDSEFFAMTNAAVNAFSATGTGTVLATFDNTHILSAGVGLKANGPLSSVVLTNNTVTGNNIGIQQQGGATVRTSSNNTIQNNATNISGTLTPVTPN